MPSLKTIFVAILTMTIFLVSLNCYVSRSSYLMKQQVERGNLYGIYELSVIPMYKSEWIDGVGYQNDTMVCCCSIGQLYEQVNIYVLDKNSFVRKVYHQIKEGYPLQVSPEVFSKQYSNKVNEDEELKDIYEHTGIDGIVNKLATRSIRDWERNDYEKFKYIVYICWKHDFFFYHETDDEILQFKWFVSGRKSLVENYYNLSNKKDVWYNPLSEE